MKPPRPPSHISIVEGALKAADDFLLPSAILAATSLKPCDVRTSLVWLHKCGAASFIVEGGQTFWFATPDTDKRSRKVLERKEEGEGARGGKHKMRVTLAKDTVHIGKRTATRTAKPPKEPAP